MDPLEQRHVRHDLRLNPTDALTPFTQPGIVAIPLGVLTVIGVSLLIRRTAAAMARHVTGRLAADPTLTALVGGDFNAGETDAGKNGVLLANDRTDGYDDTPP